ncbi:hypothetical protein E2C01_047138 [Portunus trituberculatus]|uniref:Uncharacterized protein n=1 Tax=Portunus trituberculatus TaxID=210409 RepID=A0A5B7G6M9_PORTR|nr:hypothetical protein [Portunus trituberculatus]
MKAFYPHSLTLHLPLPLCVCPRVCAQCSLAGAIWSRPSSLHCKDMYFTPYQPSVPPAQPCRDRQLEGKVDEKFYAWRRQPLGGKLGGGLARSWDAASAGFTEPY